MFTSRERDVSVDSLLRDSAPRNAAECCGDVIPPERDDNVEPGCALPSTRPFSTWDRPDLPASAGAPEQGREFGAWNEW